MELEIKQEIEICEKHISDLEEEIQEYKLKIISLESELEQIQE